MNGNGASAQVTNTNRATHYTFRYRVGVSGGELDVPGVTVSFEYVDGGTLNEHAWVLMRENLVSFFAALIAGSELTQDERAEIVGLLSGGIVIAQDMPK